MPNREDELGPIERDIDLRYCIKHKRYYRAEFGCQLCAYESIERHNTSFPEHEEVILSKCPSCREESLFWVEQENRYECMNSRCKEFYTKEQYTEAKKRINPEPLGKAWFGNEYFDSKKKKWRKST